MMGNRKEPMAPPRAGLKPPPPPRPPAWRDPASSGVVAQCRRCGHVLAWGCVACDTEQAEATCDQARAELRAMLAEVKDWLAVLESPVDDIDVLTHGEMLAKVTAILRDQPKDSGYRLVSIDTIGKLRAVLVDPANGDSDDLIREIDTLEGR